MSPQLDKSDPDYYDGPTFDFGIPEVRVRRRDGKGSVGVVMFYSDKMDFAWKARVHWGVSDGKAYLSWESPEDLEVLSK